MAATGQTKSNRINSDQHNDGRLHVIATTAQRLTSMRILHCIHRLQEYSKPPLLVVCLVAYIAPIAKKEPDSLDNFEF
jgi:hypothetical protein